MNVKRILIGIVLIQLALVAKDAQAAEPLRVWTDDSASFKVAAKFVSVSDDRSSVALQLADGRLVDVPLNRLSAEDHKYVEQLQNVERKRETRKPHKRKVKRLYGIDWHQTLDSAGAAAKPNARWKSGKPIMCFRVLGDLAGYM